MNVTNRAFSAVIASAVVALIGALAWQDAAFKTGCEAQGGEAVLFFRLNVNDLCVKGGRIIQIGGSVWQK